MSISIQQILSDAKKLSGRLKERDDVANILIQEASTIHKRIDSLRQFQEDIDLLNEVAHNKPHAQIITSIQQDNKQLREMKQENRELRAALEEHQTAMEHIMSKYREHTSKQIYNTRIDFKALHNAKYAEIIRKQAEKIQEMAIVMSHVAQIDENDTTRAQEIFAMLKTENTGLRELLGIAKDFGSIATSTRKCAATAEKAVQTENL